MCAFRTQTGRGGHTTESKQPAEVCASHTHKTRVHVKGHNDAVILSPLAPKSTACSARGTHLTTAHHTQTAGAWCQNLAAGFFLLTRPVAPAAQQHSVQSRIMAFQRLTQQMFARASSLFSTHREWVDAATVAVQTLATGICLVRYVGFWMPVRLMPYGLPCPKKGHPVNM
jgi:hypothetical protein